MPCRCVPKLLSKEALLILIQGAFLVSRTFLTDRISRIEARAGRHLISQVLLLALAFYNLMIPMTMHAFTITLSVWVHFIAMYIRSYSLCGWADNVCMRTAELPWIHQRPDGVLGPVRPSSHCQFWPEVRSKLSMGLHAYKMPS